MRTLEALLALKGKGLLLKLSLAGFGPINYMATLLVYISLLSLRFSLLSGVYSAKFIIINKCSYTVWPAIISPHKLWMPKVEIPLPTTGFTLQPSESKTLDINNSWSGTLWGRTLCTQHSTGSFSCLTGDCGTSTIECNGGEFVSSVTEAIFDLNAEEDDARVSINRGSYNLPMTVVPLGGIGGSCGESVYCSMDLSGACPTATDVCKRVKCEMREHNKYCCISAPHSSDPCNLSSYVGFLQQKCLFMSGDAGYDEGSKMYTCSSYRNSMSYCSHNCTSTPADYLITFCQTPSSDTSANLIGRATAVMTVMAAV